MRLVFEQIGAWDALLAIALWLQGLLAAYAVVTHNNLERLLDIIILK